MTDMWKIVTVTVVSEDGAEAAVRQVGDDGNVDFAISEARDAAIELYNDNIGSLDSVAHRVVVQIVKMPEPKDTVVTATLGEMPELPPVTFTAA
jgi:hypothetical protein